MANEWTTLSLYWYSGGIGGSSPVDPIFNKPIVFYLFTLPAWQLLSGWLMTIAVIVCGIAVFFITITSGSRIGSRTRSTKSDRIWRGLSISFAFLLPVLASDGPLGRCA